MHSAIVASLSRPPTPGGEEICALPELVEWLDVQVGETGPIDAEWLKQRFPGRLIYSVGDDSDDVQGELTYDAFSKATAGYDMVKLRVPRDLRAGLLERVEPEKRMLYWAGSAACEADVARRFDALKGIPAKEYVLRFRASTPGEEVGPLLFLRHLRRPNVTCLSVGRTALWSQIAAAYLGSSMIFASLGAVRNEYDLLTIESLFQDYLFPATNVPVRLFGLIGGRAHDSLSPRIYNEAYRALGLDYLYVPFETEFFSRFWGAIASSDVLDTLGLPLLGMTVVSPHKEQYFRVSSKISPMVRKGGSGNLLLRDGKDWMAYTTDPIGVLRNLDTHGIVVDGKAVALVGCGGAGRALAAALQRRRARLSLFNRGSQRGVLATSLLSIPCSPVQALDLRRYDIVINATSVGRNSGEIPFSIDHLRRETVVVDLVYGLHPTALTLAAKQAGCCFVDGVDVLIAQVSSQFRMMTGLKMPERIIRQTALRLTDRRA